MTDMHELYDRLLVAEQVILEDKDTLSKITKEIDTLSKIFTQEQIKLLRYLISIDIQYAKIDYKKANEEVESAELENVKRLFE